MAKNDENDAKNELKQLLKRLKNKYDSNRENVSIYDRDPVNLNFEIDDDFVEKQTRDHQEMKIKEIAHGVLNTTRNNNNKLDLTQRNAMKSSVNENLLNSFLIDRLLAKMTSTLRIL